MPLTVLICSHCKEKFLRPTGHANETIKLGRKPYCSLKCLGAAYKKRVLLSCENPQCNNEFERTPGGISPHNFCSRSCAAKVSNSKRQKLIKQCANPRCNNEFTGRRKYCSLDCIPKRASKYTKQSIIEEIQKFTRVKLIEVYPRHLFPENKLKRILKKIDPSHL